MATVSTNISLVDYLRLVKGSEKCKISFHYGHCDDPTFLSIFTIGVILLIPFFYEAAKLIRNGISIRRTKLNPGTSYCVLFSIENIFILIGNFLYTFHYQANQSVNTMLTIMISSILIFRVLTIISFINSFADVLASLDSQTLYGILSITSKTFYYILLLIWVFLLGCSLTSVPNTFYQYIGFTQIISIITILSSIFIALGVVLLFECFIVSKASYWIHKTYKRKMKILIFILCVSYCLMITCHYFLSSKTFKYRFIMNNMKLKSLYITGYIIYKYPVGWSLLAIISLVSQPNYIESKDDRRSTEAMASLI